MGPERGESERARSVLETATAARNLLCDRGIGGDGRKVDTTGSVLDFVRQEAAIMKTLDSGAGRECKSRRIRTCAAHA
jgi:hypothetical protein